ncbi:MAG: antibiotic biosynthesis monooxygenase family protein [bacterium]
MDFVAIQFVSQPRKRREFLLTVRPLMDLTRREPGCTSFRLFHELENRMVSLAVGTWETPRDLDRYLQSDLFQVLLGTASLLRAPPDTHVNGIPCGSAGTSSKSRPLRQPRPRWNRKTW